MVDYVQPPSQISSCWATWSETDQSVMIRTDVEAGPPMVRRRFTGTHRVASVTRRVPKAKVKFIHQWFRTLCRQGVMPTVMGEPDGTQSIWRFVEPPQIRWSDAWADYADVSATIEQLPAWFGVKP